MMKQAAAKNNRSWLLGLLLVFLLLAPFFLFGETIERSAVEFFNVPHANHIYAAYAATLLAADSLLPVPSSIIATLVAQKSGFLLAALANSLGLFLSCVIGYWIGRLGVAAYGRSGRELPEGFTSWVERNGLTAVLICRPVPVLAEASIMIAGAAQLPQLALLGACLLVQTILGTAYAFAGSSWASERSACLSIFVGAILVPGLAGLIVLWLVRRRSPMKAAPPVAS